MSHPASTIATYLRHGAKFSMALMKCLVGTKEEFPTNRLLGRCEIFLVYAADGYLGMVGSASHASMLGNIRNGRALFETYIDTEFVKRDGHPSDRLQDFREYSLVEKYKIKKLFKNDDKIIDEERAAYKKFLNSETGKPYKHWSRINTVEARAEKVGQKDAYNGFYRLASHAVHGAAGFASFYQTKERLDTLQKQSLCLSTSFTYFIFKNCFEIAEVKTPARLSELNELHELKCEIISD